MRLGGFGLMVNDMGAMILKTQSAKGQQQYWNQQRSPGEKERATLQTPKEI